MGWFFFLVTFALLLASLTADLRDALVRQHARRREDRSREPRS